MPAISTSLRSRLPYRVLLTLSVCVFALCSSEYVLVGLLVDIAQQLGVSLSRVGGLLTAYAITAALAGPIVALATTKVRLKRLILALMVLFAVANLVIGLTNSYPLLVIARSVAALSHSTFAAASIIVGVRLTPPGRAGSAISWVTAGFSAATVLGGPVGGFIGSIAGWHAAFLAVSAANLLGALAMLLVVPDVPRDEPGGLREQLRRVTNTKVASGLITTAISQAAWFAPYGYVVALLIGSSGLSVHTATAMLLVFGFGNVAGNLIGGHLADRSPQIALLSLLTALAISLFLVTLLLNHGPAVCVDLLFVGLLSGALIPVLNTWVLTAAGGNSVLSLTLVTSAFNLGNGIGAAVAGWIVAAGLISSLGLAGGLIALVALLAVIALRIADEDFMGVRDGSNSSPSAIKTRK